MRSLQFIGPDGDQRFLTGGRVAGCYFGIGRVKDAAKLCIADGFATGASVHEATGYPVAVAFNAGNLIATAQAMRAKLPDVQLIACADDDYRNEGNPGMTAATTAVRSVGGLLAIPDFGTDRPDGATGFNDMARLCGADAVTRAVAGAGAPARAGNESASAADSASGAWLRPVAKHPSEPEPRCDPLPIPSALLPVEPFDVALLPQALRGWVADIVERMQCPPDFPAVGAMVALSSVIGRKACVCPKRHDDWLVVPTLWGAIVGRPGVMKSPALAEVLTPLGKTEKNLTFATTAARPTALPADSGKTTEVVPFAPFGCAEQRTCKPRINGF